MTSEVLILMIISTTKVTTWEKWNLKEVVKIFTKNFN